MDAKFVLELEKELSFVPTGNNLLYSSLLTYALQKQTSKKMTSTICSYALPVTMKMEANFRFKRNISR